jgi:hypothetical protein
MSFSASIRKWASSVIVASFVLCLVGCSPESSTPAPGGSRPPNQAGSTTGSPKNKGRAEVPEPSPAKEEADKPNAADDKPADQKPNE